jgi:hypothetical protein
LSSDNKRKKYSKSGGYQKLCLMLYFIGVKDDDAIIFHIIIPGGYKNERR